MFPAVVCNESQILSLQFRETINSYRLLPDFLDLRLLEYAVALQSSDSWSQTLDIPLGPLNYSQIKIH